MALVFITGVAGSGKTAIRKELTARGYQAYDTDKNGISGWFSKESGKEVYSPKAEWPHRTAEWYSKHEWNVSMDKVKELVSQAKTKSIYLCGTSSNRLEVMNLCSMVIGLQVDEAVLRHRIATRKNSFGKQKHELDKIMEWRVDVEDINRKADAVMVNANRPLDEVVDEILKITLEHS